MKLIQLTDIHLTTPGQTIGGRDPNANFERALDALIKDHSDAEAIIITGDLSDWGEEADYERLKKRIAALPVPTYLCIGNHDDRDTMLSVFPMLKDEGGFVQYTFPLSIGTGIVIDTWAPNTHAGHFCKERCAWLDAQLSVLEGKSYIFMHHNPVANHIAADDEIMLLDADRLGEVVARHRDKIAHIFFGHCHLPLCGSFRGVPMSASRGTNHQGWLQYGEEVSLTGADLPESFAVIWAKEDSTMVQMYEFGYAGEFHFADSPTYDQWDKKTIVR